MPKFIVRQVVRQTLAYIVEDARSAAEAIALVKGGQVPEAYDVNGQVESTTAEEVDICPHCSERVSEHRTRDGRWRVGCCGEYAYAKKLAEAWGLWRTREESP